MKSASIYRRGRTYYVVPQCLTEVGVGIACGESGVTESSDEIYGLLMSSFEMSKDGIPHPKDQKDWNEFKKKFLSIFGVKSSAEFHKSTLMVGATLDRGVITLTPSTSRGVKHGFEGQSEEAVKVEVGAPQDLIMEAINKAFSSARSKNGVTK